ncbi:hypothetical protein [Halomonas sp. CSM-2]|uniref:hypothetical protein n=1 Tax=Halomonas sp. CSM-2 TaxID=1975722 RepID=UPI000A280BAE|nr:hypothetical protein [Halomonas sp. CSM-2]
MKGRYDHFDRKEQQVSQLCRVYRQKKGYLRANQLGDNEYKGSPIMSDLTAMIKTMTDLHQSYLVAKTQELDSVMDAVREATPEFYELADKMKEIRDKENEYKIINYKKVKYGQDATDIKSKMVVIKMKILALKNFQQNAMLK